MTALRRIRPAGPGLRCGGQTGIVALIVAVLSFGCTPETIKPDARYRALHAGEPYQVGSVWYYPRETFDLDETGLAVITAEHPPR